MKLADYIGERYLRPEIYSDVYDLWSHHNYIFVGLLMSISFIHIRIHSIIFGSKIHDDDGVWTQQLCAINDGVILDAGSKTILYQTHNNQLYTHEWEHVERQWQPNRTNTIFVAQRYFCSFSFFFWIVIPFHRRESSSLLSWCSVLVWLLSHHYSAISHSWLLSIQITTEFFFFFFLHSFRFRIIFFRCTKFLLFHIPLIKTINFRLNEIKDSTAMQAVAFALALFVCFFCVAFLFCERVLFDERQLFQ